MSAKRVLKGILLGIIFASAIALPFVRALRASSSMVDFPFDLEAADVRSGVPFNPRWRGQVGTALPDMKECGGKPWQPPCTSQATTIDDNEAKCPAGFRSGPLGGHANWQTVTYSGFLFWQDHSSNDDDYNINVATDNSGGYTVANPDYIRIEFDSDETIDHFDGTPWWKSLHDAVDGSEQRVRDILDGHRGVVVGLLGVDCAHTCPTEIHPAFALAIRGTIEPATSPDSDRWGIFVRNWGNQGYCSSGVREFRTSTITLEIPSPGGITASSVEVLPSTRFLTRHGQASGPYVDPLPAGGASVARVTFVLPEPSARERISGELYLRWTPLNRVEARKKIASTVVRKAPLGMLAQRPPDNPLEADLQKLTAIQRRAYEKSIRRPRGAADAAAAAPRLEPAVIGSLRAKDSARTPPVTGAADSTAERERDRRLEILRRVQKMR